MIRFLLVAAVVVPDTIWYGARILWAAFIKSRRLECVCEQAARGWAGVLLRVAGVKVELENADRIRRDVPQVLVANHVSWFDVLALAAYLPGTFRFVAKKEIEKAPIFGRAIAACGHIFIDRRDSAQAIDSLAAARERLAREGPTIIMFPEGTRSPTGELQRFKKGAFVLAIQTGADVVPAVISGSRDIMPKGAWRIRPGTVRVRFGEPIPVGSYTLEQRNDLLRDAREALVSLQQTVRQEDQT